MKIRKCIGEPGGSPPATNRLVRPAAGLYSAPMNHVGIGYDVHRLVEVPCGRAGG